MEKKPVAYFIGERTVQLDEARYHPFISCLISSLSKGTNLLLMRFFRFVYNVISTEVRLFGIVFVVFNMHIENILKGRFVPPDALSPQTFYLWMFFPS
jgi:hypothetical protein